MLLPLYVTGLLLVWQLAGLLSRPGPRDTEGLVKGHDFVQFYALGHAAASGRLDLLYDSPRLNALMWDLVPASRGDVFPPFYGPQVALASAPLAWLSYPSALTLWLCLSIALGAAGFACAVRLARRLPIPRAVAFLLLMLSPAVNVLLVAGQNSAIVVAALCATWWAFDRRRPLLAGAFLGVLAFKPQLAAGAIAVLVLAREWTVLTGLLVTASAQLLAGWAWAGSVVMRAYLSALSTPVRNAGIPEPLPEQVHGWAGAFRLLLGPGPVATTLYVVFAAVTLIVAARAWRHQDAPAPRTAILIVAIVLVCPHLYVYDLVILAPVLVICCDRAVLRGVTAARAGAVLAWLAWFVPLLGPMALATRVQFSTAILAGILGLLAAPVVTERGGCG